MEKAPLATTGSERGLSPPFGDAAEKVPCLLGGVVGGRERPATRQEDDRVTGRHGPYLPRLGEPLDVLLTESQVAERREPDRGLLEHR